MNRVLFNSRFLLGNIAWGDGAPHVSLLLRDMGVGEAWASPLAAEPSGWFYHPRVCSM